MVGDRGAYVPQFWEEVERIEFAQDLNRGPLSAGYLRPDASLHNLEMTLAP